MKTVRLVFCILVATALLTAVGLGSPGVLSTASAAAPREVTSSASALSQGSAPAAKKTYPKKSQTSVRVYELQQRLVKVGALRSKDVTGHYGAATVTAVKKFQRTQRLKVSGTVTPRTWTTLAFWSGAKPALRVPGLDRRCQVRGRAICVDKTRRKLYFVEGSQVRQIMDTRFGCRSTPTREGLFSLQRKSRYHTSSEYHVYMPWAMFFSGGQAVHWSTAFLQNGYDGCSHGCVNIRDKKGLSWLYEQMRVGDRVVVYRS